MNPSDLLQLFPDQVLKVDSTRDYRRREMRKAIDQEFSGLDPSNIAMRLEPDTNWLYVDCGWLGEPEALDEDTAQIFRCSQFMGTKTVRLLKGTGHNDKPVKAYVFDLRKIPTRVQTIVGKDRRAALNKALRDSQRNMAVVAREMQFKDEFDRRLGLIPAAFRTAIKDDLDGLKRLCNDLMQQNKQLSNCIVELETGRPPKAKRRTVAKDTVCSKLDILVDKNKGHFVWIRRKPDVTGLVESITHADKSEEPWGVIKDTMDMLGRNHKVGVAVRTSVLREAGIPPKAYRRDPRYIGSQSVYIKLEGGEHMICHCARFDMKKRG